MYPIGGYDALVIVSAVPLLILSISHDFGAIDTEACICSHVDAAIESFEMSLPRHRVLLFAYIFANNLDCGLTSLAWQQLLMRAIILVP